ncbi:hypothetical protein PoB_002180400 [Plakobranchus ocellatus]|uniref:Uncharacterized protein n=1 Tax=Plakobranchus ocellatus TaxID=259542 RepID=A0AAV3ZLQ6_9GAST|nr:hypothetical protein PoB_002180400 [Plakobranchus ocellatus]
MYGVPPNTPTDFMMQFFASCERQGLLRGQAGYNWRAAGPRRWADGEQEQGQNAQEIEGRNHPDLHLESVGHKEGQGTNSSEVESFEQVQVTNEIVLADISKKLNKFLTHSPPRKRETPMLSEEKLENGASTASEEEVEEMMVNPDICSGLGQSNGSARGWTRDTKLQDIVEEVDMSGSPAQPREDSDHADHPPGQSSNDSIAEAENVRSNLPDVTVRLSRT